MFNESRVLLIIYLFNISGVLGADPQRLAISWIYYQNNRFLGMFQLKFCLNTFETCLLYVSSVFNVAF